MVGPPELLALAFTLSAATAPGAPFPGPRGEVVLPSGTVLSVELADTPVKRAVGYMFREAIAEGEGMVFLHDEIGFHPFWMKNCKVSLDIIWMDERWGIVHIERELPPCREDPCPSYQPLQAARYVLEIQGGMAQRHGLALGDRIIYMAPPIPPRHPGKEPPSRKPDPEGGR